MKIQPYPAARPENIAEIIALDCLVTDLIAKCKGNARELDELVGVLDAHLGYCEAERDALLPVITANNTRSQK